MSMLANAYAQQVSITKCSTLKRKNVTHCFSFTAQIVCAILYLQTVRVWARVEQINSARFIASHLPRGAVRDWADMPPSTIERLFVVHRGWDGIFFLSLNVTVACISSIKIHFFT